MNKAARDEVERVARWRDCFAHTATLARLAHLTQEVEVWFDDPDFAEAMYMLEQQTITVCAMLDLLVPGWRNIDFSTDEWTETLGASDE